MLTALKREFEARDTQSFGQDLDFEIFMCRAKGPNFLDEVSEILCDSNPRFTGVYAVELLLILLASPRTPVVKSVCNLVMSKRARTLRLPREDFAYKFILTLCKEYREGLSAGSLQCLGQELERLDKFFSFSHVMLAWLAAGRLIERIGFADSSLADFCFHSYQGLSTQITGGESKDSLGLLSV